MSYHVRESDREYEQHSQVYLLARRIVLIQRLLWASITIPVMALVTLLCEVI